MDPLLRKSRHLNRRPRCQAPRRKSQFQWINFKFKPLLLMALISLVFLAPVAEAQANIFAVAFECDDDFQDISGNTDPRPVGHMLQICVGPDLQTRLREVFMQSVDRLTIGQTEGVASMEIVKDTVEASQDVLMLCQPNSLICRIKVRLSEELFYTPPEGTLTASGEVSLQYYTEDDQGNRKLQSSVLDFVLGRNSGNSKRKLQRSGYVGKAGIRFEIPVESIDRPDAAAIKEAEDDLSTWWEESPTWLKICSILLVVVLVIAILVICCFGFCCNACRRTKKKEIEHVVKRQSAAANNTQTIVRVESARQRSIGSNIGQSEQAPYPDDKLTVPVPMDSDSEDDDSITLGDDFEEELKSEQHRDRRTRPNDSMVQRTWEQNSVDSFVSMNSKGSSLGLLDTEMYKSTRIAVDPDEDLILNEGDTPVAHDVCFDADDHPGTQDFLKAVINGVKKHGEQKYGPQVYRTIKKQLPNRRFWVCETEDGPDEWRELKKKELIEFVGQTYNDVQEERLKANTKKKKKKKATKKKKKKAKEDAEGNTEKEEEVEGGDEDSINSES